MPLAVCAEALRSECAPVRLEQASNRSRYPAIRQLILHCCVADDRNTCVAPRRKGQEWVMTGTGFQVLRQNINRQSVELLCGVCRDPKANSLRATLKQAQQQLPRQSCLRTGRGGVCKALGKVLNELVVRKRHRPPPSTLHCGVRVHVSHTRDAPRKLAPGRHAFSGHVFSGVRCRRGADCPQRSHSLLCQLRPFCV